MMLVFFAFCISKSLIIYESHYSPEIYSQIQSLHSIQSFLLYIFKQFMASMG